MSSMDPNNSRFSPFSPLYHSLWSSQVLKTSGIIDAPIPITHTMAHCLDRMETAHGTPP